MYVVFMRVIFCQLYFYYSPKNVLSGVCFTFFGKMVIPELEDVQALNS